MAEAGVLLHVSPAHLVRSFTRAFGIAPHRYLLARRIDAARSERGAAHVGDVDRAGVDRQIVLLRLVAHAQLVEEHRGDVG